MSFRDAFDELYPSAVRLATRIVGDQASGEDVAAEALARAYAHWAKVSRLPYRDAWVLRVTGNLAIDAVRRRRRSPQAILTDEFEEATALRLALASALTRLPERQREAIVLRYLAGYSEAEASVVLGISANSVKTHTQRGLAALRRGFGNEGRTVVAL